MKMYVAEKWMEKSEKIEVKNPFDETIVDTVPSASFEDVDCALKTAQKGAAIMEKMDQQLLQTQKK